MIPRFPASHTWTASTRSAPRIQELRVMWWVSKRMLQICVGRRSVPCVSRSGRSHHAGEWIPLGIVLEETGHSKECQHLLFIRRRMLNLVHSRHLHQRVILGFENLLHEFPHYGKIVFSPHFHFVGFRKNSEPRSLHPHSTTSQPHPNQ